MEESIKRIVAIISCMCGRNAEIVVNISEEKCYLFFDGIPQNMEIYYEEVDCLVYNGIIELDGGCDEKGYETRVYRLTGFAQDRIREIIKDKKTLSLKALKE